MIVDHTEYSVCTDCLISISHGHNDSTSEAEDKHLDMRMRDELNGRKGHWVPGVPATNDNGDGSAYEEFSTAQCELCMDSRAGSRHGVTLLIEGDEPLTITRRVTWEVDVVFPVDSSDRDIAKAVAETYFQQRIADGEPDTACVFKVQQLPETGSQGCVEVDLSK